MSKPTAIRPTDKLSGPMSRDEEWKWPETPTTPRDTIAAYFRNWGRVEAYRTADDLVARLHLPAMTATGQKDGVGELLAALRAANGYLLNAKIDLETGATKRTAIRTIEGGLRVVSAAIAKATGGQS